MELTLKSLHDDRDAFLAAGYHLPEFDYDTVHKNTVEHPHWIHFGAGNIFRAFQANVAQNLLNSGVLDTGLIAAEGYDYEIIEKKLPSPRQFKHSRHLKGRQHRGKDHRRQHHGVSDPGQ